MYTEKQLHNGKRKLNRAELWRHDNADAWRCMVNTAKDLAEHEQTISGSMLVEAVRHKAFIDRNGDDTKINNDLAPIVTRWIAAEHPETARYIKRRKTVFDLLMA